MYDLSQEAATLSSFMLQHSFVLQIIYGATAESRQAIPASATPVPSPPCAVSEMHVASLMISPPSGMVMVGSSRRASDLSAEQGSREDLIWLLQDEELFALLTTHLPAS